MTAKHTAYWLYGKHSVFSALKNPKRVFHSILVTENFAKDNEALLENHEYEIATASHIDSAIKANNNSHQGIAALVDPLEYKTINEFIKKVKEKSRSVLVALDQITDPQNAGAIIRSCAAFSADGILVTKHNSFPENAVLAKASSGTVENIDIISVANLSNSFDELKKNGFWIIGLDGEGQENVSKLKEYDKVVIVLGAEGTGIRRLTKENCDLIAKINISNDVESLNVSVATAIALYEFNN